MKPWVFLVSALAIKTAFVTIYLVALLSQKGDQPTALQQAFTEWRCSSAEPQGKERGWMCCPKGWKRFQKKCYYISDDTMSWAESVQNCTGMGSHLVVINSKAEQVFVSEEIQQSSRGPNFYIGLSAEKVGQWQWVDRTPFNVSAAPETTLNNWNDVRCEHHYRVCEAAAVTV
ncbi:C-type lectin domain family 4 member D-like isoform X2 [Strix uralensis]|uniref:C-type lectin domain family 4 member D-like isoform X2 n=1 Tax=Strix uralensis TaxID=36305 RepID=UPI003DA72353